MTAPDTSTASSSAPQPYFWFTGASVQELYARLTAADPATCRLEVRTRSGKCYFRVVPKQNETMTAETAQPDVNDSFLCPPICPGG